MGTDICNVPFNFYLILILAEAIIDENMGTIVAVDGDVHVEMNEGSQDIPEDREDKIKVLLDLFKEKDLVTLTNQVKTILSMHRAGVETP